jgi:DNA-binding NtrC family response regulator
MVAHKLRVSVLIVDDDDTTLQAMACLLTAAGYETQTASNLRDALRTLRQTPPPDLLLADVRLGEFNGLQLLAGNPIPSIIITGYPDPVLEADARRMGADFLIKPIVPPDFLELVARKLASTRT